jgi:superfamily I DNA/RNA helicase
MGLPLPIGRQKEVLYLPARGHFVVLGTAGSGKTTLAILRSAYLADPHTDHHGKTLLVTFNRALVAYLRHLQDRRLGNVVVENYHRFARGYLASHSKLASNAILSNVDQRKRFIAKAVEQISSRYKPHSIFNRPVDLFSEEFRWIAQHGITDLEIYRDVERIGRAGVRIERRLRDVVWEIYQSYRALREGAGKYHDWDDLAIAVCLELDADAISRRYRHVVIDEGQDFSPEMLRSLAKAIPPDGSLTFFGDVAQQIYGHRMSWRSAGLDVAKVLEFKENYRNSRQIARLGLAISQMPYFLDVPDIVEPVSPTADGPLPTLIECSSIDKEIELVVSQATIASRTLSVAILLRNRQDEEHLRERLPASSIRLHRDMKTWLSGPGVRYGTYHAAKGLEFDMIILPFCSSERLPDPEAVAAFGGEDSMIQDGRLLYVGITRAKTRLIMTFSGGITPLLPTDARLYKRVQY